LGAGGTLGRFTLPGTRPYSASRFAVEACSDARRMELAPYRVLVTPGVTTLDPLTRRFTTMNVTERPCHVEWL
jgi:NADP-dependent 3-hydroxy acid dehydrogenase YdfG